MTPTDHSGTGASRAPPRLPTAYNLIAYDVLGSTNDEAKRLAAEGAEDGTLVWAKEQSAGRGRHGRDWESPAGNLYLSLIVRPECGPSEALQLGFVAALAVGQTLGTLVPPMTDLRYKWPNDVMLNGNKVAGILMETATRGDGTLDWLVLGIGINVQSHPSETNLPAISLRAVGAEVLDCGEILTMFCRNFLAQVTKWLESGFDPIRESWLHYAFALGERIEVRPGGQTLAGTFVELDRSGALILETDDGELKTITYGDVFPAGG